jgi:hypothetical protein
LRAAREAIFAEFRLASKRKNFAGAKIPQLGAQTIALP